MWFCHQNCLELIAVFQYYYSWECICRYKKQKDLITTIPFVFFKWKILFACGSWILMKGSLFLWYDGSWWDICLWMVELFTIAHSAHVRESIFSEVSSYFRRWSGLKLYVITIPSTIAGNIEICAGSFVGDFCSIQIKYFRECEFTSMLRRFVNSLVLKYPRVQIV